MSLSPARRLVLVLTPAFAAGALALAAPATAAPATVAASSASAAATPEHSLPDHYIVVLRDDVTDVEAVAADHARRFGASVSHTYRAALKGYAATVPAARLAALKADARVEYVSPDTVVTATATAPVVPGDEVPAGVRRIDAATTTTAHAASSVNVAIIDTGVDLTHPDLNAVTGTNCVRKGASADDDNGHGSHVAGTISGRNNGSGVVGVAPGTRIYAVKVLNRQGSGTTAQVICGIDWVTANAARLNIKVANMSLGGGGSNDNNCGNTNNDAQHRAICRSTEAGVTYVVAAGNDGGDLAAHVPASYPEALTVSAITDSDGVAGGTGAAPACRTTERDDTYASFSNYATSAADQNHLIAAPGVCVKSTWKSGGYNTISGTSMATPHVAGSVALCLGTGGATGPCTGLTPAQIVQKLRSDAQTNATAANGFTGDPSNPVAGKAFGFLTWDGDY